MSLLRKIEDRKKQQEMLAKKKNAKIATTGVALGAITGVVAGIILSPKSGKEQLENLKMLLRKSNINSKDKQKIRRLK